MKPNLSLPASVEERLSGWARIQEARLKAPASARPAPSITLSRQFGCEGFPLAMLLRDRLGAGGEPWSVFDKSLLEQVAQDEGISMRLLNRLGDPARALEAFGFHPYGAVTHDEAFAKVAETLVRVAAHGHAIVIGRGGAVLCRSLENCFHFRLEAGFEWRVASIMRRAGVDRAEAEHRVKVNTKLRERFIQDCLDTDVNDPRHYDAVFNNERHSVAEIAAAITAYLAEASRSPA